MIRKFLDNEEIKSFQNLYKELPIEINNTRQKIIKKKWSLEFNKDLQKIYTQKLKKVIGEHEMDNPETKEGSKSLGLFQESYMPVHYMLIPDLTLIKLFINKLIFTNTGETIIFKNRFYGCSTTFL